MPRKICIVVGSRANYGSIKSVLRAVKESDQLALQVVTMASAVLDRYGRVADLMREDGFESDEELTSLIEGETPLTMAKSTGLGLIELSSTFARLKPDFVVTVGDRFETIGTALAAAYLNIPLAHTMGGEVSGTIDESIRHAVTKFAHVHFPASKDAAQRVIRMGEREEDVHLVGCPRIDTVAEVLAEKKPLAPDEVFAGVGAPFDLRKPFLLVSEHPVTTEYGEGQQQINATLDAVSRVGLPALVLWPNADAGSEDIARGIRIFRERAGERAKNMFFVKNLPVDVYVRLMAATACLVGNSSSGIREGAFIGTPSVNIGSRQAGRERGHNIIDVSHDITAIERAILDQIAHGRYVMDRTYGDGGAGRRIADVLATKTVNIQKRIAY